MLPLEMLGPDEIAQAVAGRARALRLARNLSQAGLAAAAGVTTASLKRFERTGQIAFVSLVRLAIALEATAELESWFSAPPVRSIDEALARQRPRQRGRRT
jgi:transcriptional regulator with XRE-family HTH domain